MSRVTSEANVLGTFGYSYVDDQSGGSRGQTRLSSISYPNGQVTNFGYFDALQEYRLQQISNLKSNGTALSQFSYGYDSASEITQWQQIQNGNNQNGSYGYDLAGQLTSAQTGSINPPVPYSAQNYYSYDLASNRTGAQKSATQTATVGGTITASDTVTITVTDPALTSPEAVSYTVQSGDTLTSIAANLGAAISADTNLQGIGVNATSNGSSIFIKSVSPNITTYAQSTSGGATESITLGVNGNTVALGTVSSPITSGYIPSGQTITVTVHDPALSGGTESVTYTTGASATVATVAAGIQSAINADSNLSSLGVTAAGANAYGNFWITSTSTNTTTYSEAASAGAQVNLSFSLSQNITWNAMISGSKTTSDTVTITVYDQTLLGGPETVTYTVLSTDTLSSIAAGLASAINADSNLQAIGVTATSSGQVITMKSTSATLPFSNNPNGTAYRGTTNTGATELITTGINTNGTQLAAIGGSATTSDTVTVTVYDAGISGGSKAETYTVQSGDTLTTIAAGLAAVINGDSAMSAIGVTANSVSTVVNINSQSVNSTTYTQSTSGGATETVTLGTSTSATQYGYNNVNELTSIAAGGT